MGGLNKCVSVSPSELTYNVPYTVQCDFDPQYVIVYAQDTTHYGSTGNGLYVMECDVVNDYEHLFQSNYTSASTNFMRTLSNTGADQKIVKNGGQISYIPISTVFASFYTRICIFG